MTLAVEMTPVLGDLSSAAVACRTLLGQSQWLAQETVSCLGAWASEMGTWGIEVSQVGFRVGLGSAGLRQGLSSKSPYPAPSTSRTLGCNMPKTVGSRWGGFQVESCSELQMALLGMVELQKGTDI